MTLRPPMVLDPATLVDSGHWEGIDEFLYDPKWRILLFLRAEASLELTVEFLCSLELFNGEEEVAFGFDITSATVMSFSLRGTKFKLSVADLGWLLGIYTLEETRSEEFASLPDALDSEFDAKKFWQANGWGSFVDGYTYARDWKHPAWRILHHALIHSFFGREDAPDTVQESDMFFFWSLHAKVPVNVATFVARFLFSQSLTNKQLLCGPLVTLLARSLKVQIPAAEMIPEDLSIFRPHMGYVIEISLNQKDEEEPPRKKRKTTPMTIRELSQALFAFQDSVESRLERLETTARNQQWQVESILEYVVEQRIWKDRKERLKEDNMTWK